jgi:hypothetical protein
MNNQTATSEACGADAVRAVATWKARAALALMLAAGAAAWGFVEIPRRQAKKLERARDDMRLLLTAINSIDIDKTTKLDAVEGNALPPEITAPRHSSPRPLIDPFGDGAETYRFVATAGCDHSEGVNLFASRGPDGDWDVDKMERFPRYAPVVMPSDAHRLRTVRDGERVLHKWEEGAALAGVSWYTLANGERFEFEPVGDNLAFPPHAARDRWKFDAAYLAARGIHQYDPTNGAYSDGDIYVFYPNWR